MSNALGERWVLLTVRNNSTGSRVLKGEHLVATFANDQRRHARSLDKRIAGHTVRTLAISFGQNNFPIVQVEMD